MHQPVRLQSYKLMENLINHYYYNDYENEILIKEISEKYYLPSNRILYDLIHFTKNDFKFSFLFSGIVIDMLELYVPEAIESYKSLIDTGCVELLSGTYSNAFGPLLDYQVYLDQVKLQNARIKSVFGKNTFVSKNGDLNNYQNRLTTPTIKLLLEDSTSNKFISHIADNKKGLYLKPKKLVNMINKYSKKGFELIDIFIPYNISDDSQTSADILEFLELFPAKVLSDTDFTFDIPSGKKEDSDEPIQTEFQTEDAVSNLEIFLADCNEMQIDAFQKLNSYTEQMQKCDDPLLKKDWLYLQACDHFYYMNPLFYKENDPSRKLLPYSSPFLSYINYMNILMDFSSRLDKWFWCNDTNGAGYSNKIITFDKNSRDSITHRRKKKIETDRT